MHMNEGSASSEVAGSRCLSPFFSLFLSIYIVALSFNMSKYSTCGSDSGENDNISFFSSS